MKRMLRLLFGPIRIESPRPPMLDHQPCGHPLAARVIRDGATRCWACDCAAEERAA